MNRFGTALRVTLEGTSHGPFLDTEVEGLPEGQTVDIARVQSQLDRRRAMGRPLASKRQEPDLVEFVDGLSDGRTTKGAVRARVANLDVDRAAYEELRFRPRPGHADLPARQRYGPDADLSGGGIFSGRMTVGLVIAGALAQELLTPKGIKVVGFTRTIGAVDFDAPEGMSPEEIAARRDSHEIGAVDHSAAERMADEIRTARKASDSVGGIIEVRAFGVPVGLGEPFFDSIESEVAHLAFSVPAVKGVEFGAGFRAARMRGSDHNDAFGWEAGRVVSKTNHAGGILGGLATGAPVVVRAAVKPTSSIARPQQTVDLRTGESVEIVVKGRHDPCIVPRAVVVLESVVAFALADLGLQGGFLP